MLTINKGNGADRLLYEVVDRCIEEHEPPIVIVCMGIAYGGEVEVIARKLMGKGRVYGYDTFEELHPKVVFRGTSEDRFEIECMQGWYDNAHYGTAPLSYDYQRQELDRLGLTNSYLIKGIVDSRTKIKEKKIHLAFLDMDIYESMRDGYLAVKDSLKKGSYLCLHDAIPYNHIPRVHAYFKPMMENKKEWEVVVYNPASYFVALQKL